MSASDIIVLCVIERHLATGEESTVKDIAAALGWSESKVRRTIDANISEVSHRLRWSQGAKPTFSTAYRSMEHGHVKVTMYEPRLSLLRGALCAEAIACAMRTLSRAPSCWNCA